MAQHHPKEAFQADLEALAEVFEAEDREDRRAEAQRRRDGLPEPKRDTRTFPGFADGGATPRGVRDTAALARFVRARVQTGGMNLYTKNGRPLQVSGDPLYSRSGTYLGTISNGKVYGPKGRYAGTIDGDRVVYRSIDSASMGSANVSGNRRSEPRWLRHVG